MHCLPEQMFLTIRSPSDPMRGHELPLVQHVRAAPGRNPLARRLQQKESQTAEIVCNQVMEQQRIYGRSRHLVASRKFGSWSGTKPGLHACEDSRCFSGVEQSVARQAHNLEAAGSNPASAIRERERARCQEGGISSCRRDEKSWKSGLPTPPLESIPKSKTRTLHDATR